MSNKIILDACCGGRMMWFNKKHPNALYIDNRVMPRELIWQDKTGNEQAWFEVTPDRVMDFRKMEFDDNSFHLVVFDPPHLVQNSKPGWQGKKYGFLGTKTWKKDIVLGFSECMRVLKPYGTLIFKWNDTDKSVSEILKILPDQPLFGHKSGKQQKTHWLCFMKIPRDSLK